MFVKFSNIGNQFSFSGYKRNVKTMQLQGKFCFKKNMKYGHLLQDFRLKQMLKKPMDI